ncbi:MAG TPA: hypothetical protein VMS08_05895 [Candidatus Saccharimonadia bacterium]|nr:hypothetical protein [Candidatus Saccharimonadia bacterium]
MASKTVRINIKWVVVVLVLVVVVAGDVIAHGTSPRRQRTASGTAKAVATAHAGTRSGSCNGGQTYAQCTSNGGLLFTNKPSILGSSN